MAQGVSTAADTGGNTVIDTGGDTDAGGGPVAGRGLIVEFVEPIPGFPDERRFLFSAIDPEGVLFTLRSMTTPRLRFVVMPPAAFFPDYQPDVTVEQVRPLGLGEDAELQVLVIVSVRDGLADATANLLAPIVMVAESGQAMQVVLNDPTLPLRAPLVAAAS
jgi:flagellar assembly factor FliW